ncbi:Transmembrane transporter [Exophiala dermatitidis]
MNVNMSEEHKMKIEEDGTELGRTPTVQEGDTIPRRISVQDAVFGTVALMMKTQIGLGVLSIPAAFDVLGLIPGVICLLLIAAITTWSDYMVGMFKLRHRDVYSIDDAGALMFGKIGRYILGSAFILYWAFVAGSGMLGISIGLNAVSTHGACTAIFVAVAALAGFLLGSIQTLGRITWLAWLGLTCILTAIFTVTIAVGVQDRPTAAPQEGPWSSDYKLFNNPSFAEASAALSSLVFAYSGTPGFFAIVSEMRDPRHYTRSLLICQSGVTAVYMSIGVVVYYYCGSYVASPALGSAGHLMKKISYGFALPGLLVTTTLVIHVSHSLVQHYRTSELTLKWVPSKYLFVRILRGSVHLATPTFVHWATWFSCTFGITITAFIIASTIPVFGGLVSLIGALLGTLLSFQPMGCMWLYDNWKKDKTERSTKWTLMVGFSVFVVVIGTFLMAVGTYGSIVGVIDSYKESGGSAAFSCADNSNSI